MLAGRGEKMVSIMRRRGVMSLIIRGNPDDLGFVDDEEGISALGGHIEENEERADPFHEEIAHSVRRNGFTVQIDFSPKDCPVRQFYPYPLGLGLLPFIVVLVVFFVIHAIVPDRDR
jgi:hypothetical protein